MITVVENNLNAKQVFVVNLSLNSNHCRDVSSRDGILPCNIHEVLHLQNVSAISQCFNQYYLQNLSKYTVTPVNLLQFLPYDCVCKMAEESSQTPSTSATSGDAQKSNSVTFPAPASLQT